MSKTFETIVSEHLEWASVTFPKGTAVGALLHLKREADEVIHDILNSASKEYKTEEYADCLGCLMDSINREGISIAELLDAYDKKLQKNKGRTWRDNGDGSYSHIKP